MGDHGELAVTLVGRARVGPAVLGLLLDDLLAHGHQRSLPRVSRLIGEHDGGERQGGGGEEHAHRAGQAELALLEGGVEQVLGHREGGVLGAAAGVEGGHVDERVEREDAEVDVGGLDGVAHHRQGDHHRHPDAARAVDAGGVVQLGRDALDGGDEQHHVEADEAPDDDEHGHRHRGGDLTEPGEGLEPVESDTGQETVDQAARRVEHLRPDQADDDGRDRVGEERDDPVDGRPVQAAHRAGAGTADGDHRRQGQREHDGDERDDEGQQQVVADRLEEDVVVQQGLVVGQADEVEGVGEPAPVGERVDERLDEGPQHEQGVERERQTEGDQDEHDAGAVHPASTGTPEPRGAGGGWDDIRHRGHDCRHGWPSCPAVVTSGAGGARGRPARHRCRAGRRVT